MCVDVIFNESLLYFIARQPSPPFDYYFSTLVPVVPVRQDKPLQFYVRRKRSVIVPLAQSPIVQSSSPTWDPSFPLVSTIAPFDPDSLPIAFAR